MSAGAELGVRVSFEEFLLELERKWIRTILLLGITLIPLFGVLDMVMMPAAKLKLFWAIRAITVLICILQYLILARFDLGRYSIAHAYVFTFVVGGMISYMTTHLGGFESSYYAGLNLVVVAVNLFLPWEARHGALNGLMIFVQYIVLNALIDHAWQWSSLINNLYFMGATTIIAVTIGFHKHRLTRSEFDARAALWGEMEIAKKIQTALLPADRQRIGNYDIAGLMIPASEVGGDYYDIVPVGAEGAGWVTMGDVSGHGVTAGLIMMMAQTSILSALQEEPDVLPSRMMPKINRLLRANIERLGEIKFMTAIAVRLEANGCTVAGKHQDLLIYRAAHRIVEVLPTFGFWLGLRELGPDNFRDEFVAMAPGDTILLFTDGATEIENASEEMFGVERLAAEFKRLGEASIDHCLAGLLAAIQDFGVRQDDDLTLVLIRR